MPKKHLVGIIADVHGEVQLLRQALTHFRQNDVETVAILGDLFDRLDQADRCAQLLSDWDLIGVFGNHEHEAIATAKDSGCFQLESDTFDILDRFHTVYVERFGARFTHDLLSEKRTNPIDRILSRNSAVCDVSLPPLVFYGHTHHRQIRNEHGIIDLNHQVVTLNGSKSYYVNPGPLADGQFLIWNRVRNELKFSQL